MSSLTFDTEDDAWEHVLGTGECQYAAECSEQSTNVMDVWSYGPIPVCTKCYQFYISLSEF